MFAKIIYNKLKKDDLIKRMDRNFSSFKAEIDTEVLNQINQVDAKVKSDILLNDGNKSFNNLRHDSESAPWSPEPIFTFGKAKSPMFNIRASPTIPSPEPTKICNSIKR